MTIISVTKTLTTFEKAIIVDALRKAKKDPMSMDSINQTRKELVELMHVGDVVITYTPSKEG